MLLNFLVTWIETADLTSELPDTALTILDRCGWLVDTCYIYANYIVSVIKNANQYNLDPIIEVIPPARLPRPSMTLKQVWLVAAMQHTMYSSPTECALNVQQHVWRRYLHHQSDI